MINQGKLTLKRGGENMKRKNVLLKKVILSLCFALSFAVCAGVLGSFAAEIPDENFKYEVTKEAENDNNGKVAIIGFQTEISGNIEISSQIQYEGNTYDITEIGPQAFIGCSDLQSVIIPNGVTSIGEGAFAETGLTSVAIPSTVTSIGDGAFAGCTNLQSITIQEGVVIISNLAFQGTGITSVVVPSTVSVMGTGVFDGCQSLQKVFLFMDFENKSVSTYGINTENTNVYFYGFPEVYAVSPDSPDVGKTPVEITAASVVEGADSLTKDSMGDGYIITNPDLKGVRTYTDPNSSGGGQGETPDEDDIKIEPPCCYGYGEHTLGDEEFTEQADSDHIGGTYKICQKCGTIIFQEPTDFDTSKDCPTKYPDGTAIGDKVTPAMKSFDTATVNGKKIEVIVEDPLSNYPGGFVIRVDKVSEDLGRDYDGTYSVEKSYKVDVSLYKRISKMNFDDEDAFNNASNVVISVARAFMEELSEKYGTLIDNLLRNEDGLVRLYLEHENNPEAVKEEFEKYGAGTFDLFDRLMKEEKKFEVDGKKYLVSFKEVMRMYALFSEMDGIPAFVKEEGQLKGKVRMLLEIPDDDWDEEEIEALRVNLGDDTEYAEKIEYRLYDKDGKFLKVVDKDYVPQNGETIKKFIVFWTDHFSEYGLVDELTERDLLEAETANAENAENAANVKGGALKTGENLDLLYFSGSLFSLAAIAVYFAIKNRKKYTA